MNNRIASPPPIAFCYVYRILLRVSHLLIMNVNCNEIFSPYAYLSSIRSSIEFSIHFPYSEAVSACQRLHFHALPLLHF